MTKVFIIAIVMWWADPPATPTKDSVEITHKHGLPLYFATQQECFNHVDDNIPTAHTVKSIYCLEREKFIDNNEI